jgi:hypothetical protein
MDEAPTQLPRCSETLQPHPKHRWRFLGLVRDAVEQANTCRSTGQEDEVIVVNLILYGPRRILELWRAD